MRPLLPFLLIALLGSQACSDGPTASVPLESRAVATSTIAPNVDWSDNITLDLATMVGLGDREWVIPMDVSADGRTISFLTSSYERYLWTGGALRLLAGSFEGVNSRGQAVSYSGQLWDNGVITQLRGPCGDGSSRYISETGIVAGSAPAGPSCHSTPAIWIDGEFRDAWPSELDRVSLEQTWPHGCDGNFEAISDQGVAVGWIYCSDGLQQIQFGIVYMNGVTRVINGRLPDDAVADYCAAGDDGSVLLSGYIWKAGTYTRLTSLPGMPADFFINCGQGIGSNGAIVGFRRTAEGDFIGGTWKEGVYTEYPTLLFVNAIALDGSVIGQSRPQTAAVPMTSPSAAPATASASAAAATSMAATTASSERFAIVRRLTAPERLVRFCENVRLLAGSGSLSSSLANAYCAQASRARDLLLKGQVAPTTGVLGGLLKEIDAAAANGRLTRPLAETFRTDLQKALAR